VYVLLSVTISKVQYDQYACDSRYYQDIKTMPAISDQDINAVLAEESRVCPRCCYLLILFIGKY